MFGTAKEEIAQSDAIWGSSSVSALREQQEEDFGWWSGAYEFKMPGEEKLKAEEGEWESHTTNSGSMRGNKLIEILSSSYLQLFIDVDEDTRKKRKKLSATEQLANGIIWQADRDAMRIPSGKPVQASASTMAVVRGGVVSSLYWFTDEKTKKPKRAVRIYDPLFCQWEEAEEEIIWFCYRDYITKHFIERTYKKQKEDGFNFGNLDSPGFDKVLRFTFWNDEEYRVACNGEWLTDGVRHGLDHIPINIRSCGAIPYLSSPTYAETMKYSWQSYAVNTRRVYPLESKLLSIEASIAAENAKRTAMAEYNSTLSNNQPPDLKVLGYGDKKRNKVVFLDAAKGHKFWGFADQPNNAVTDAFYNRVEARMDITAGLDQQTLEMLARSGNTSLAAELRSAAEEAVAPFRKCVEDTFIWLAEEGVSQFIEGDYEKVVVEGRDRKRERFYTDGLSAKDVEESHFDCHLVSSRARDEQLDLDMAIRAVGAGLSSPQTEMVKRNLHQDPDKELDNIAQANALRISMADPVYHNKQMAGWYKEQGNEEMALYHLSLAAIAIRETVQKAAGLLNPQAVPGGNGEKLPEAVPEMTAPPVPPSGGL